MALLKSRKNKKFDYEPRYFKNEGEGSPYKIEHKFDKFRNTVGDNKGLKSRFKDAWSDLRSPTEQVVATRILILVAILVLVFLFIIDFDLSIFYSN
jgi:hypothetical protein